jgi:hypothetical protein
MTAPAMAHARNALGLAACVALVMCGSSPGPAQGTASDASVLGRDGEATGPAGDGDVAPTAGDDAAGGSPGPSPSEGGATAGGDAGPPAACPASEAGNTPLGKDTPDPDPGASAVAAITYTNVGAAGSYNQVVNSTVAPSCTPNVCDKTPKSVSGPLVPFDEEMTMVFSGPMDLYQLAAYEPAPDGYRRVAYWDRCTTDGLAVVGNKKWYQCNGYVQSYVSADGTMGSDTPVQFGGHLDAGIGINVMSATACAGSTAGSDCGFSRGLALHGFKGDAAGSKIFAVKFRMPLGNVTPAYWILPAQVVRSAQYGCNCRGQGGQGGCGELDVAEVLGGNTPNPPHPMQATTTIYSFQGVTNGGTSYFQRPVYETATFLVIFDAPSRSIAMRRLSATAFDFRGSLSSATVAQWLADPGTARKMP